MRFVFRLTYVKRIYIRLQLKSTCKYQKMAKWKLKIVKFNQKYQLKSIFKTWGWNERGKRNTNGSVHCSSKHAIEAIWLMILTHWETEDAIMKNTLFGSIYNNLQTVNRLSTICVYFDFELLFLVERCTYYHMGENWKWKKQETHSFCCPFLFPWSGSTANVFFVRKSWPASIIIINN